MVCHFAEQIPIASATGTTLIHSSLLLFASTQNV